MPVHRQLAAFSWSVALVASCLLGCSNSNSPIDATKTEGPSPTAGHPISTTLPPNITPPEGAVPITGVSALTAGGYHTCALTNGGSVECWGSNTFGQLGDGTTTDRALAADVLGLTDDVDQVSAGFYHTCVLLKRGAVQCWGSNDKGAIGNGTTEEARTEPTDVVGLQSGVTAIAAGREHTCAVLDGNAWCWGDNTYGEIGDGTAQRARVSPVLVAGLNGSVASISAGWYHTCALLETHEVECWGNNVYGQLGIGQPGTGRVDTPVVVQGLPDDVVSLASGGGHNCVLTASQRVICWGGNNYGQIGDGTTTDRATPVAVGLSGDVAAMTVGTGQTCALMASGGMKCWGHDWYGELGDGTSSRGNIKPLPVDVLGLPGGVTSLAMGRFHTCVLTNDGRPWCWGRNGFGEVGDGTRAQRPAAVAILGTPGSS